MPFGLLPPLSSISFEEYSPTFIHCSSKLRDILFPSFLELFLQHLLHIHKTLHMVTMNNKNVIVFFERFIFNITTIYKQL